MAVAVLFCTILVSKDGLCCFDGLYSLVYLFLTALCLCVKIDLGNICQSIVNSDLTIVRIAGHQIKCHLILFSGLLVITQLVEDVTSVEVINVRLCKS